MRWLELIRRRWSKREGESVSLASFTWRLRLWQNRERFELIIGNNDSGTIQGEIGGPASRLAARLPAGVTTSSDPHSEAARELLLLIEQACRNGITITQFDSRRPDLHGPRQPRDIPFTGRAAKRHQFPAE